MLVHELKYCGHSTLHNTLVKHILCLIPATAKIPMEMVNLSVYT